jgi:transposase
MRTKTLNQLKALIVCAPEPIRSQLRHKTPRALMQACEHLQIHSDEDEVTTTVAVINLLIRRIQGLECEIAEYDKVINRLTQDLCPQFREELGVGPVNAALLYLSWSYAGRFHNEAAFAMSAGVAPLEASSGKPNATA